MQVSCNLIVFNFYLILIPQIPFVWDEFLPEADEDFSRACMRYERNLDAMGDGDTPPDVPVPRMQVGEVRNFLRLSTAIKLLLASSVCEESIVRGQTLLSEYLLGLHEVSNSSRYLRVFL